MTKKFALVEWIADEQFGTMPVSAVQDDKLHVGMKTKMRYLSKGNDTTTWRFLSYLVC